MPQQAHELTYRLLGELGIESPNPALAEQIEEHFSKVILEVLLRAMAPERLPELQAKVAGNAADLDV